MSARAVYGDIPNATRYYSEVQAYRYQLNNAGNLSANYRNYLGSNLRTYATELNRVTGIATKVPTYRSNSLFNVLLNLY